MQYGGLSNGTFPSWSPIAVIGTAFLGVFLFAWLASRDAPAR